MNYLLVQINYAIDQLGINYIGLQECLSLPVNNSSSIFHLFIQGSIQSVAFSPNGRLLVAGDSEGCLTVWDIGQGRIMANIQAHQSQLSSFAFSREGHVLATG